MGIARQDSGEAVEQEEKKREYTSDFVEIPGDRRGARLVSPGELSWNFSRSNAVTGLFGYIRFSVRSWKIYAVPGAASAGVLKIPG